MSDGCALLAALPWVELPAAAGPNGRTRVPVPIPFAADLRGAVVRSQGISLDPNGAYLDLAAWTGGLEITLGD